MDDTKIFMWFCLIAAGVVCSLARGRLRRKTKDSPEENRYITAVHRAELQSLYCMLQAKDEFVAAVQAREQRHKWFIRDLLDAAEREGATHIANLCKRYLMVHGGEND